LGEGVDIYIRFAYIEDRMDIKTNRQLVLPFLFTLIMGIVGVVGACLGFREKIFLYPWQLVGALFVGVGLGLGVFIIEKTIYTRQRLRRKSRSSHKPAALWKFVSPVLVIVAVGSKGEMQGVILFALGIYFLTLTVIFYRMQKNR
jgi:F0F1-type ATP synthase assembly protein I